MDAALRAYLEKPTPRPKPKAHGDVHFLWSVPLGVTILAAIIVSQIPMDRGFALVVVVVSLLLALGLGMKIRQLRQSLMRLGTFGLGIVTAIDLEIESEDISVDVKLEVKSDMAGGHRTPANARLALYSFGLTDRWLDSAHKPPFAIGDELPILMSVTNRDAIVFLRDDLIDAVRDK